MNIKDLFTHEMAISTAAIFKSDQATATVIQILQGEQLKEHVSKVPALLICVMGKAVFENEKGVKETLQLGDFIKIEPMVKHLVNAIIDCHLLLFK
jgi:quercetin dioxygenase-like cupin family protein